MTRGRRAHPWIVLVDNKEKTAGGSFHCQRCGDTYYVTFPVSVGMYVAMAEAYTRDHRGCREEKKEQP